MHEYSRPWSPLRSRGDNLRRLTKVLPTFGRIAAWVALYVNTKLLPTHTSERTLNGIPDNPGKDRPRPSSRKKDRGTGKKRKGPRSEMRYGNEPPSTIRFHAQHCSAPQSRLPTEEIQRRYNEDRTDDGRNTVRSGGHSSLKENVNLHRPPPVHPKDPQHIIPPSASFQRLFEAQSRELSIFQNECRTLLEEKKAITDAYAALKQQHDERSKKLNDVRLERQTALEQKKEVDEAYVALKQQHDEQTKKLNTVRQERQAALEQKQKAEEGYAALRQKYDAQKNEYNALNNKYHSLKATLEQRTLELQGAQRFLTTADTFSGTEVVNTLRKLNEEVQQSTAFMAEWAVENFMLETPSTDQTTPQDIEQTRTLEILGTRFMQLLGTKKHKDNPILIEMAFRAYLIYELYCIASPWSVGQEEQSHNLYIDAIYQRIREGGKAFLVRCGAMHDAF